MQNNWGGDDSADKRDWLAGQVVEQFPSFVPTTTSNATSTSSSSSEKQQPPPQQEEPDAEYVEELLLQVMLDEFEVNVDDESAFDVAAEIVRLRGQCAKGNFDDVDKLQARWQARKGTKVVFTQGQDEDGDTDWDDTDGDDDDEEMDDAPALVAAGDAPKAKEKQAPEVDEDGFTKVKRKR